MKTLRRWLRWRRHTLPDTGALTEMFPTWVDK